MNVLSLFDGMSCGQIALERAGIKYDNYFASEIDKYAIQITQKNYPNTIQIGDARSVSTNKLPKIDLIMGGFCCQSFSSAGNRSNFNDLRGKLFFECVRLLEEVRLVNPKAYFLFENVVMDKKSENIITEKLGVSPIKINSSLVSAQNRIRLYWTNIPNICQPMDKNIKLTDVLDDLKFRDIPKCFYNYYGNDIRINKSINWILNKKSNCLTTKNTHYSLYLFNYDKSLCRLLTPNEYERLQTVPENYTEGVSNTQRFKMIGNGWTVDVIKHILSFINYEKSKI